MSDKKEFRISSEDAARPKATINDDPHYFAQGLKPKPRHAVETEIVENNDGSFARVTTYNDGINVASAIHVDNPEVQASLKAKKAVRSPKK